MLQPVVITRCCNACLPQETWDNKFHIEFHWIYMFTSFEVLSYAFILPPGSAQAKECETECWGEWKACRCKRIQTDRERHQFFTVCYAFFIIFYYENPPALWSAERFGPFHVFQRVPGAKATCGKKETHWDAFCSQRCLNRHNEMLKEKRDEKQLCFKETSKVAVCGGGQRPKPRACQVRSSRVQTQGESHHSKIRFLSCFYLHSVELCMYKYV